MFVVTLNLIGRFKISYLLQCVDAIVIAQCDQRHNVTWRGLNVASSEIVPYLESMKSAEPVYMYSKTCLKCSCSCSSRLILSKNLANTFWKVKSGDLEFLLWGFCPSWSFFKHCSKCLRPSTQHLKSNDYQSAVKGIFGYYCNRKRWTKRGKGEQTIRWTGIFSSPTMSVRSDNVSSLWSLENPFWIVRP